MGKYNQLFLSFVIVSIGAAVATGFYVSTIPGGGSPICAGAAVFGFLMAISARMSISRQ